MSRRAAEHAAGYGETGRSSTGAARRVEHRSAAAIGNDSPRLLTTRGVRTTHSRAVNRPCVARVMQQESTRISTGREATLPDGPAWSEKPCHAFSVANGRTKFSCQALPKNTKPSVFADAGDRHASTFDRHLPGSISFWDRR